MNKKKTRMKTKNLVMAMAALAMAGCSQNEVTDVNPDAHPVIGFDVYTGVQTKGVETDNDALKASDAGFGFFAYKTTGNWSDNISTATPDFLYNEHGTWTAGSPSGSWGYKNLRFWPTNNKDKITFFAYAPYESTTDGTDKGITLSKSTETGAPYLEFAVPTGDDWADKMVDLVTDCRTDIQNLTATSDKLSSGKVSFKFSHVLTKVADIKVKPSKDLGNDIKIYVKGLRLLTGSSSSPLPDKAKYQFSNDEWNNISYITEPKVLTGFLNKTAADFCGYTEQSVDVSNHTTATSLFPAERAFYFIPVNNTTGTAAKGVLKLSLEYDIVTKVTESTNVISTTKKEVELPAGTFKKGTAHTYTLTIKLNSIDIDVDATDISWGAVTGGEDIDVE